MLVAIIAEQTAGSLIGQSYGQSLEFNPMQMADGRWFISILEAEYVNEGDIVEMINYEPEPNFEG